MPSHRAAADSGPAPALAPLRQWEGRLREASGWASDVSPIEPMHQGEPVRPWSTTTGRSMSVVAPRPSLDAPVGSWAPRQGGAPAIERTALPVRDAAARGHFGLEEFEELGANPFAAAASRDDALSAGSFGEGLPGEGPRHSTGPLALPGSPAPASSRLPAPRAAQEQSFSPARGRRALLDPITDPGLVLADLPLPVYDDAATARRAEAARGQGPRDGTTPRVSGRRRSHAAPDALPAPREHAPTPGGGSAVPPQTRRARREAASARAHALGTDDDAHAGPSLAAPAAPLTGRWMPPAEPFSTGSFDVEPGDLKARAAMAAVSTALLDLPPSPYWTPQQLEAEVEPQADPGEVDDPDALPVFVPSRGRSVHRRASRALGLLPQAGLVGALGLATVLAPMASQHLPYLNDASTPSSGTSSGVGAVTAPVKDAANLLLKGVSPTAAASAVASRHQPSASRSALRTTSPVTSAGSSSPSSAASSTSPSSVAASSAPAPSVAPSSSAPASQTPSTVPPSPAAALVLAPPTSTPSPSASASASATATATASSAEQLAVTAMVPGCSGATPDTSDEVNGRLDSQDLCGLWQPGQSLRSDAAVAFAELNVAYKAHFGEDMQLTASYRPYADQVRLKATRPSLAAVPGTSEHGWGLAVDLGDGVQNSDEHYAWLMANAPKYGWSHPAWAQRGGGGPYEPWHWEYAAGES